MDDVPIHEIDTIFRGPYVGKSTKKYTKEAQGPPLTSYIVDDSSQGNQLPSISFMQEDDEVVHSLHCDVLVVRAVVAHNGLKQMLADNNNSINILFEATFDEMIMNHELTPITTHYTILLATTSSIRVK